MTAKDFWATARSACLLVLALTNAELLAAQDNSVTQRELRIPLRQIAISADFGALGETISQRTLLSIANNKRRELPKSVSYNDLLSIKDAITDYMREQGYKFHVARLPVQELSKGNVSFSIVAVTLDEVTLKNKSKIGDEVFKRGFENELKKPLYQPRIDQVLSQLRSNSLVEVFAYYSRGSTENSIRLNINVTPKRQLVGSIGVDNYGTASVGEERMMLQAQWQNPTLAMDQLSAVVLVSNGDSELNTFGYLAYQRPIFGLRNRVRLSASNNVFELGDSLATLELAGDASIFSFSAERDIKQSSSSKQTVAVKTESRSTEYEGILSDDLSETSSLTELKWQLNHSKTPAVRHYAFVTYAQGDTEFGMADVRKFSYSKVGYQLSYYPNTLAKGRGASQFIFSLRHQQASEKLSSFDQLSLAGIGGVRALAPGQFSVDSGTLLRLDWRLPRLFARADQRRWRFVPFFTFDIADGQKIDESGDTIEQAGLTGLGTGLMLSHTSGFSAKASIASALQSEVEFETTNNSNNTRELNTSGVLFEMLYRW